MAKLAIISSYDEECGAAFYSARLKKHLETLGNHQVDVLRLNIGLLRATDSLSVKKAKVHINDLINRMKEFDGVCMQFEPGLYGGAVHLAYPRILKLFDAHPNIVATIHGFHRPSPQGGLWGTLRSIYKKQRGRGFLSNVWEMYSSVKSRKFWRQVKQRSNVKVLTFNASDEAYFRQNFELTHISNFPITYYSKEEVSTYKQKTNRDDYLRKHNLDPSKKYIGIFGFISPYKGHLVAFKMLEQLPKDYELLIIGGEHPHGLEPEVFVSNNIKHLIAYLNNDKINNSQPAIWKEFLNGVQFGQKEFLNLGTADAKLKERIHFLGQVSDDEMPSFYSVIDYAILPYMKTFTGQSGSGPAVFALEFNCKTIFSNAPVFKILERYFPGAMMFTGIGNYYELASAIQKYDNFEDELSDNLKKALEKYNPATMVEKYNEMLGLK